MQMVRSNYIRWKYSWIMRILSLILFLPWLHGMAQFGPAVLVQAGSGVTGPGSNFLLHDVDGDGAMDVVHGLWPTGSIQWFRNSDGLGTFVSQDPIELSPNDKRSFCMADMDLDGDLDVVIYERIVDQHRIRLFDNLGNGTFAPPIMIGEGPEMDLPSITWGESVGELICDDINGDTLPDVIYTTNGGLRWFLNTGVGTFSTVQSYDRGAISHLSTTLRLSDLNADGHPDVITSAGFATIELYTAINVSGNADEWDPISLYAPYNNYENVTMMDIDEDGDEDVMDVGTSIEWYENPSAQNVGPFEFHWIEPGENNGSSGIGKIGCNSQYTVVYGRWPWGPNQLRLWWRHYDDQLGNFAELQFNESPKGVYFRLGDLNNDGHLDLVTWKNDTTRWYPYDPDYLTSLLDLQLPFDTLTLNDAPQPLSGGSPEGGTYSLAGSTDTITVFDPIEAGLGEHQLVYSYTDPFTGCSGTDTATVVIELSTSIARNDLDIGIEVFPNPANDHCTISFRHGPADLQLIDATGRMVRQWRAASSPIQADLSPFHPGIYLMRTEHADQQGQIKVIIQ